MKMYKVHDSMRLSIAAIRDKLSDVLALDEEFDTLGPERREHYQKLLNRAEDLAFAAMYAETDGKTLKQIADFISAMGGAVEKSVFAFA